MKPKVLLYQVPLEKAKQLTSALAMMGVRTEQVAPGDIYQKVGYLAGAGRLCVGGGAGGSGWGSGPRRNSAGRFW